MLFPEQAIPPPKRFYLYCNARVGFEIAVSGSVRYCAVERCVLPYPYAVKKGPGLLDTGPLVSFLASGLRHHDWTVAQWKHLQPPLLTCEPVVTEAAFLLKREGHETDALFALLERERFV